MTNEQLEKLKDFLLAHYNKTDIDLSLYDFCYFNNLYLIEADCYRIYIDNPDNFRLEDHIKKHQKWNKTIESAALYILREQSFQRIYNEDRVILLKAKILGLDLSRIAKILFSKNVLTEEQFTMFTRESIVITLDTPIYIEHTIHSVEELLKFIS